MRNNGISPGRSAPLGATVCADGVNFSLYCRNGALVELLLFDKVPRMIRRSSGYETGR